MMAIPGAKPANFACDSDADHLVRSSREPHSGMVH
ncbi:hypothetical protein SAMN05892877_10281 [Rhizobium subbaraonis]|uniref:Uncharacterized protein n=1 Tax=Rhizobium subbaraonis TaxID=908946 RepID=A0A285U1H2_9HYPH|nr:hypothetical protein SAMN05892877_10281 [Rhizobium subbaraonis]